MTNKDIEEFTAKLVSLKNTVTLNDQLIKALKTEIRGLRITLDDQYCKSAKQELLIDYITKD